MNELSEVPATLIISCQQTRFHIAEENASRELDIKDLSITIPHYNDAPNMPSQSLKIKKAAKLRGEGLEILTGAELKLKTGIHYGLLAGNGQGKSTLLRAIAEKLIPGIPLSTRIAILQQTMEGESMQSSSQSNATASSSKTVLQQVVEGDPFRNALQDELDVLTKGIDESKEPLSAVRALRRVQNQRISRELFEAQKTARLRSGTRGSDARKALIAVEKMFEESEKRLRQLDDEIDPQTIQDETDEAIGLQTELAEKLSSMQPAEIEAKARSVLAGLGFKEAQLSKTFSSLSGGWKIRALLATTLAQTSDILLLDEPTNYLDLLGILWLQHYLDSLFTTHPDTIVVIVSHDRDFVNAACQETIILRDKTLTYFGGNLASYEKSTRREMLRLTRMHDAQERQKDHMEKTIVHNMRMGRKKGDDKAVRQAKSRQKKLDERMGMQVNASGHRFKLNRDRVGFFSDGARAAIEVPKEQRGVTMHFPEAPDLRFPGSLVSLEKVTFKYRNQTRPTPILQDADLVIHPGDRVGVLGLNGQGKSTLVRLLVDDLRPSSGTVSKHPRLRLGYYSQHSVEALQELGRAEPTLTPLSLVMSNHRYADTSNHGSGIGGGGGGTSRGGGDDDEHAVDLAEHEARGLLSSFGVTGRTASDLPLSKLSGGQLVRVALTRLFLARPHLLVLDEPTTHLDIPTVTALTHALRDFSGALLLVSHDRFLIRCVVEGEPVVDNDPDGSSGGSDEDDGGADEDDDERDQVDDGRHGKTKRRRLVYELKAGKLIEKDGGVAKWETGLVARLKKLGL